MKVLDIGCGPGFFSVEIAKMVGKDGKVFSADLQEGMLLKLKNKIKGTQLEERINLIKVEPGEIKLPEKVDFILAFYMVHEIPDKEYFFGVMKNIMDEEGQFLIVEPKLFHVSQQEFNLTLQKAMKAGFTINPGPKCAI